MASVFKVPAKNKQGYKWKCVMEGPPDPVTGKRQQVPRVRDTQKEAIAAAQAVVDRMKGGTDTKRAKKMKFNEAAQEWLQDYIITSGVKGKTVEAHVSDINLLNKYYGGANIDKITHNQHQKMLNNLFSEGYEINSIYRYHSTANLIFKWIIKENLRIDNPCQNIKMPKKQRTVLEAKNNALEEKFLERSEIEEFLEVLQNHGLGDDLETFYFLLFSGVRPGEFCALEWPDFNFETHDVHIYKTLHFPQGGSGAYQLTPPKTTGSVRTFDVDDFIVEMFKRLKVTQSSRHKRYKELHDDFVETQFILTNNNGTPFTNWKLVNRMARLMKLTNIKKHATPHIFRHTHITMLIEASIASGSQIDLKTIMKRVGHDDAKTTLKIYTHVTERMMQSSSDKLKIHFQNILTPKDLPEM
ncbi:hypothetical protein BK125_28335 [Paenibacillus odorifer]|uniref:Site-specific integrase n=1 Tax=Paenibacillus odorifer TaxID=189426 RepID=A0ABX3GD29_9BACL|nr:tyrosine-type recombinase/integrase [Paenibacillus odorifer]OMC67717.1 hypothetical protein BK125_28335 [Paenibacillus odorifer]OMD03082.1 hypothetical protein BSO21_32200 [Paenibacillus odorifer]